MPAGVETEATALAAFLDLPNVTKAYFTATKATTAQLTVSPVHLTFWPMCSAVASSLQAKC